MNFPIECIQVKDIYLLTFSYYDTFSEWFRVWGSNNQRISRVKVEIFLEQREVAFLSTVHL